MNRRETPPGAPHPPISSGLTFSSHQLTVGQPEPLVKPASEAAHQPGQQQMSGRRDEGSIPEGLTVQTTGAHGGRARLCGGVQRGEIKSAPETRCGARGGSRLGHPSDEDG